MDIHEVFDAMDVGEEETSLHIPESWLQGRTAFGGLVAVVGLSALRQKVDPKLPLRNLLVAFVGPTGKEGVIARSRVLRRGKSVTHVQGEVMTAQGDICATVHGCFGAARSSHVERGGLSSPAWPSPEDLTELPFMEGLSPNFTRYLRYCWAEGPYPYEGKPDGCYGGWSSCHGESRPVDESYLVALMDAWPSPSLSMLTTLSPASTLTWSLDLLQSGEGFFTSDWWQFATHVDTACSGYVGEEARLWAPDGTLAGVSRQSVTVFG